MKRLLIILLSLVCLQTFGQTTNTFTRVTTDFIAPGKGGQHWGTSPWDDVYAPTLPAGNATPKDYYTRFNWTDIESSTTQGSYSFTAFDAFVNQAIDDGAMYSFGVMCMCTACGLPEPEYPGYLHVLMQAEATNSKDWQNANGNWVPNWNSPNYISRYAALMRAIWNHINTTSHSGKNYRDALWMVDTRSYGDFGEGHTYPWTGTEPTGRTATSASLKVLVDSLKAIYPIYQLTIPMAYFDHGHDSDLPLDFGYYVLTTSNSYGEIGYRRDNLGDPGYTDWLINSPDSYNPGDSVHNFKYIIRKKWRVAPVGGEPARDDGAVGRNLGLTFYYDLHNEDSVQGLSYFGNSNYETNSSSNTGEVTNIRNASAEQGYKLVIDSVTTPTSPTSNGILPIKIYWKNIGIAPVYQKWNFIYELRNGATVVARDTSHFNSRLFLPASSDSVVLDTMSLSSVSTATDTLFIIMKDPVGYRAPLPIAITGRRTDGSYMLRNGIVIGSATVTANAGSNQTIDLPNTSVILDGTGSTGTITSYAWTRTSGPNTPTIVSASSSTTSVTGLIQGTYVFQLSLNSGVSTSNVTITVNPNTSPTAVITGSSSITLPTSSVALSGTSSFDPDGTITGYTWSNISGPTTPSLSSTTTSTITVTGMIQGSYVFQLVVTDNGSATGSTQKTVVVNPVPPVADVLTRRKGFKKCFK